MPGMVPSDLLELAWTSDPRVSPDGTTVAFVAGRIDGETQTYRAQIWLAALDGSSPPRPFTAGAKRDGSPRWSPDGSMLAFTSDRDGDNAALYVVPLSGGEARKVASVPHEDVDEIAWSPDGTRIAFAARVRSADYDETDDAKRPPRRLRRLRFRLDDVGWIADRPKHLFVVPADGSTTPLQITDGEMDDAEPAWSPDGTAIAFASSRHQDWDVVLAGDIYVVPADGGEIRVVTATDGTCSAPSWSPDGASIAFSYTPGIGDEPRHGQVAIVPATGGAPRVLTGALDRNCAPYPGVREPLWSGDDLVFCVEDGGCTHVYRVPVSGEAPPAVVVDGRTTVVGLDVVGDAIAYVAADPVTPAEVFAGDGRRLTEVSAAFTRGRVLVMPEPFTATSPDGAEVSAWFVRPPGLEPGQRCPVLLCIHGGPFTQYGERFFDEFQVYAGAGYGVVFCNPRGSSGYGEAWGRAIRGPSADAGPGWGSVDYEDLMAVLDEALRRFDVCDPDRVGVLGGSYGGYMTSWIVGHTDRFKAAVSERSVNLFSSMWGSSDFGWGMRDTVGSYLHEDPAAWWDRSPLAHARDITTPLLIMHSENDMRCDIEQAEQLFTTLRVLRREVEFVRFPGESHELSRSGSPPHRIQRFEIILEWFDRYVR